jgi:hypothetical protein
MPKLEELYKAKGFTDADLELLKPLLTDQRYRSVVEETLQNLETEATLFKTENERWDAWHKGDGQKLMNDMEREKLEAIERAASLEARLKEAEKSGFSPRREDPAPNPNPATPATPAFDAKKLGLVTMDDAKRFLEAEGQAIAQAADIIEEYRILSGGKSLFDYEYRTQDGRTLRGMEAIRAEKTDPNISLKQFAAKKFDFEGKRNAIAEKQRLAAEEAIRADERAKFVQQYGQPGQGPMMPSKEPFIPRPREGTTGHPWERGSASEQRAQRIERAMKTQIQAVN